MLRIAIASCLLALVGTSASASSIVVNGSFETTIGMPGNGEVNAGSSAIVGWTVTGSSPTGDVIDWIGPGGAGPTWLVSDGTHAIDLDGRDSLGGGIAQTLSTVAGAYYLVEFDLSGNPHGLPVVKSLRASVAGLHYDFQFDTTGLTTDTLIWKTISFQFLASSGAETLSFTSLSGFPNSYGALIDNVKVQQLAAVPEPSTAALSALGFLALAGFRGLQRLRR